MIQIGKPDGSLSGFKEDVSEEKAEKDKTEPGKEREVIDRIIIFGSESEPEKPVEIKSDKAEQQSGTEYRNSQEKVCPSETKQGVGEDNGKADEVENTEKYGPFF
jgi:hypothetical protein